jgi:hypothetical protein
MAAPPEAQRVARRGSSMASSSAPSAHPAGFALPVEDVTPVLAADVAAVQAADPAS